MPKGSFWNHCCIVTNYPPLNSRIKVQSCPMCREIDIDIRNLFAEKASLSWSCSSSALLNRRSLLCRSPASSAPTAAESRFSTKKRRHMSAFASIEFVFINFQHMYRSQNKRNVKPRYRPYICPYIECDHKLAADAVVLHVSSAHREECRR